MTFLWNLETWKTKKIYYGFWNGLYSEYLQYYQEMYRKNALPALI